MPYRGARGKKGKEKKREEEEEKKGARTEAKEEERSSFLSARSSRFLSGLDSRNRHKSRHFIICGGRHGWRYDRVKNSPESAVREWLARREFAAGAGKGGFKYGYVRTYD